jgi:hypothetical protein
MPEECGGEPKQRITHGHPGTGGFKEAGILPAGNSRWNLFQRGNLTWVEGDREEGSAGGGYSRSKILEIRMPVEGVIGKT